ncbi:hypothetical protein CEXT_25751 [Caerostris extrusa]|uniref:Uncharacterized protein n=1 Tax=Caerostris extrusa TaxID=172846 RepID=A0AAV4TRU5_CAEEX|nr:hypothetical protein CEXT_25751 [Caerostris extrusa]
MIDMKQNTEPPLQKLGKPNLVSIDGLVPVTVGPALFRKGNHQPSQFLNSWLIPPGTKPDNTLQAVLFVSSRTGRTVFHSSSSSVFSKVQFTTRAGISPELGPPLEK